MRARKTSLLLAAALAAACEREDLAPLIPDVPEPEDPPPGCGDGLPNDDEICLRRSSVKLPYAYSFIRLSDFDGDGAPDFFAMNWGRPDGGFTSLASFDTAHGITMAGNEFFGDLAKVSHLGFIDLDGGGMLALVYAHAQRPELVVHPHIAETRGDMPTIIPLDFPANSLFVDDLAGDGETDIYVTISDIVEIEATKEVPDGLVQTHYLVRLSPDP